jgi:CelD/BcsL family acetyltransferase involved in cellulose biosynthesis
MASIALEERSLAHHAERDDVVLLDLEDARWTDLVEADPASLPFHRPAWARFLADCYRYRAFVLGLTGPGGRLVAGVPLIETRSPLGSRSWTCLPFTDNCGPVVRPDTGEGAVARLVEELDQARAAAGVARAEVRDAFPGDRAVVRPAAVLHQLALESDPAAVAGRFRSSIRQGIRGAAKAGVVVRRGDAQSDLTEIFYRLHVQTRRRLGVPVQGKRFFRLLWERVLAPGGGFVLVASVDDEPVAAAVFLTGGNTVVYKYGASDERAWKARPNNALFAHAIEWACTNGHTTFDFGRSDFESEGLRRFKSSWAAEETPLLYSTLGNAGTPDHGHGRLGTIAATVIRRSPSVVCRAGGLLYRWAA